VPSERHYLDHASTSPIRPEAAREVRAWLDEAVSGDPGRVHEEGRAARGAIEDARADVAAWLGTRPARIVFTSGATESVNAAVSGAARAAPGRPIVVADVEHSCVRDASSRVAPVLAWRVDRLGRVDLGHLDELVSGGGDDRPALVNCQLANHEVGTVQPVSEVVARCRSAGVMVHVDAAAGAGYLGLDLEGLGADLVSLSGHKLGAPPGTGLLYVRQGLRLDPLIVGGSQERARRAGMENVPAIAGLGAVARALAATGALAEAAGTARAQTDALAAACSGVGDTVVLGDPDTRAPHLVALAIGGVRAEAVLLGLDRAGIAAHSGSACSSESIEPSPVLAAMGVDPDISLRLSVGWSTEDADVTAFAEAIGPVVSRLRALGDP